MVSVKMLLAVLLVLFAVPAFAATGRLTWGDNSFNESGFEIERKGALCTDTGGTWAQIGTTAANINTYDDTTVIEAQPYCFRVRAVNAAGKSGYSPTVGGTPPFSIPAAPGQPGLTWLP
jgi:hypothetical protein